MRAQPEQGGIRNWSCKKRWSKRAEVAQKEILWSLFITCQLAITFTCQHDQPVGVCSGRLTKKGGGVLGAGTAKKGVLGASPTRRKGGLRYGSCNKWGSLPRHIHVPVLDIYVSGGLHIC